jgi:hypothetical protein
MVIINDIVHFTVADLIPLGFKRAQVDKKTSEGTYAFIFHEGVKLIPYTGIPETTRAEKNMPPHEALLATCRQDQLLRLSGFDDAAYNHYLNHSMVKRTRTHTREAAAKAKAEQVHVLARLAAMTNTEARALGCSSKEDLYTRAIPALQKLAEERNWPHWKCTTVPGLRKRLKPFIQLRKGKINATQAYDSLLNKRVGNDNAQCLGPEQHNLIIQLYSDGNAKPNTAQVHHMYSNKAKELVNAGLWADKVLVEESTVRQFLYKPAIKQLWYEARHGYQQYRNIYELVTHRQRASFANAMWVIDGTPSHRYFQAGDKGRYFRFNIFPILDAHSWCVVGFWLSETETAEAVLGALRAACTVTGCMPYQILYDNSSAIKSYVAQEAIHKISVTSFPTTVGNARAKIIEPFFKLFNSEVQRFRPGYTHNPFALRLDNRPNREALALMVKSHELPAAAAAIQQAIEDFTLWNNKPRKMLGGQSPIQVLRASMEATASRQRKFTKAIDIEAFYTLPGEEKRVRTMIDGKPVTSNTFIPNTYELTNRGIEIVFAGQRVYYQVAEADFRAQFTGQKFSVRYEPNKELWQGGQPAELLLYLQGQPVQWQGVHMAAVPAQKFAMAVADYRPGEGAQLRQHLNGKKQQRQLVQQRFADVIESTKRNGTYTEVITDNAFDKQVLQDAQENILNQVINGREYNLLNAPTPEPDTTRTDRLADYDKPLPLD